MKRNKRIQRTAILGAMLMVGSIAISSCKSGHPCPAYNSHKKYGKKGYASVVQVIDISQA